MKKSLVIGCLAAFFLVSIALLPALAIEGTATIKAQDLYSLAQRKTYRLGLRASSISPASATVKSAVDLGLEFDAKLNENVDAGPRFGVASYQLNGTATSAVHFGFGGRLYLSYWGEYGSTHGFFNAYIDGELDYYTGSNISGFGGYGGAGLELAFGPNATGYGAVAYQKTSGSIGLSGMVIQVGTRLAFI